MARALRTLLVWLIMLTLPMQTFSASLMALRMALPEQTQHTLIVMDCHEATGSASADTEHEDAHTPGAFKAKACSSCPTGVLISSLALSPTLPDTIAHYRAEPAQRGQSHIPDGLDRPPKRIS